MGWDKQEMPDSVCVCVWYVVYVSAGKNFSLYIVDLAGMNYSLW